MWNGFSVDFVDTIKFSSIRSLFFEIQLYYVVFAFVSYLRTRDIVMILARC